MSISIIVSGKFRSNGSMDNTPGTLTSPDKDRVKSLGDERNAVSNVSSDHEIKQNGVHDCEHVPMEETTLARKSATPEGHSMAFTVDFGDEDSKKSVEGRSLSDFVPSKIRKSFRERKEKSAEKAEVKAVKAEVKAAKAVEKAAEASHNTPVGLLFVICHGLFVNLGIQEDRSSQRSTGPD